MNLLFFFQEIFFVLFFLRLKSKWTKKLRFNLFFNKHKRYFAAHQKQQECILEKNSRFTDSGLVKTCDEFPKIQYFFLHENGNSSQLMFHKEMTLIRKKVTLIVEIGLLMDFFILFQFMQVLKNKITTV